MNSVKETRRVRAQYDDTTITVYQAYRPEIAVAALRDGTFSDGFSLSRMTWIKPSFAWMLYRAGYGTKEGQEFILRIRISREGFEEILADATLSHFDERFFDSEQAWKERIAATSNRVQWDPDRNLKLGRLERRAIQVGIQGQHVRRYVHDWIQQIEDVTDLAHEIRRVAVANGGDYPEVPEERVYPIPESLRRPIGME